MRFALVGRTDALRPVVDHIVANPAHELVAVHGAAEDRQALLARAPEAAWLDHWEAILVEQEIDAVLVESTADDPADEELLRRLTQGGLRLIVAGGGLSPIFAAELAMIAEDNQSRLAEITPSEDHPALAELRGLIEPVEPRQLGTIESIEWHRPLRQREKPAVLAALALDAARIGAATGEIARVSAQGHSHEDLAYATLRVTLTGELGIPVRWGVVAASPDRVPAVEVIGSAGSARLTMPDDPRAWQLEICPTGADRRTQTWPDEAGAADDLATATTTLHGPDWQAAWTATIRHAEVAEAASRSLARGRTVDLIAQSYREEDVFRGAMAIGGCGFLLLLTALVIMLTLAEAFGLAAAGPVLRLLLVLAAVAGLGFGLLQLLRPKSTAPKPGG